MIRSRYNAGIMPNLAKYATAEAAVAGELPADAPESAKQMVREDWATERQSRARKAEIINRYAKTLGIEPKVLIEKVKLVINGYELKRHQFSSEEKFNLFNQMMEEINNA